jgi:hypothetical protein
MARSYVHLFNDVVSSRKYIEPNDPMIANNKLEMMWKKTIISYLEVLCRYCPEKNKEITNSIRTVVNPTDIRSGDLSNTNQKHHQFHQFVPSVAHK